jgi:hypothetical protein
VERLRTTTENFSRGSAIPGQVRTEELQNTSEVRCRRSNPFPFVGNVEGSVNALVNILSQHIPGGTEESHEKLQARVPDELKKLSLCLIN